MSGSRALASNNAEPSGTSRASSAPSLRAVTRPASSLHFVPVRWSASAHAWRHTCATHLVKNDANLRHVQDILGHRSLNTTERYLRLAITDLKEAHRNFHPREPRSDKP